MRLPYIKMCGFTDAAEAHHAALSGADLIGLNFYAESARAISFGLALKIQEAAHRARKERKSKRPVRTVAVMVDPEAEHVLAVLRDVKPDILQFHGDEPPHFCQYFQHPFIKAFRLKSSVDVKKIDDYKGGYCIAHLIDAFSAEYGGTGKLLSPQLIREGLSRSKGFLAGGLSPKNVGALVREHRPYGVDVASGIEIRPGVKSRELVDEFIREVREAARSVS